MDIIELANQAPLVNGKRSLWMHQMAKRVGLKWLGKYMKGQIEHSSDLGALPVSQLLDEIEAEALDTLSYVNELRRRIK